MKKVFISMMMAAFVLSLSAAAVLAGDKVHGEKGQGGVVQECVEPGDCPWEN